MIATQLALLELPTAQDYTDTTDLKRFLTALEGSPIALDTETTFNKKLSKANHLQQTSLQFIQMAQADRAVMVRISKQNQAEIIQLLTPIFSDVTQRWILHNYSFDAWVLWRFLGLRVKGLVFDTLIVSQALYAGHPPTVRHDLGSCARRMLKQELDKSMQVSDWSQPLTQEQIDYALMDVKILLPLREALLENAKRTKMTSTLKRELYFLPIAVEAQIIGAHFDRVEAEKALRQLEVEVKDAMDGLYKIGGLAFNPRSAKQKVKLLNELLDEEVASSGAPALKKLALVHTEAPILKALLAYAKIEKQRQMLQSLIDLSDQSPDGRIHPSFKPMGAATGRLSCQQPNSQNIPRGSLFRSLFTAPNGKRLVIADFSQIELRIAAEIAGEEKLITAFNTGQDLHTLTAVMVWGEGVSYDDAAIALKDDKHPQYKHWKGLRQIAKSLNFGLLYGAGWGGLQAYIFNSSGKLLDEAESRDLRDRFFKAYPGLAAWHQRLNQSCKHLPHTLTIAGRRRYFPLPHGHESSNRRLTIFANTPVQGTGADMFKDAAIAVHRLLDSELQGCQIVNMVHDELVLEVPETNAEQLCKLIEETMIDACKHYLKRVPVLVEAGVGETWADK